MTFYRSVIHVKNVHDINGTMKYHIILSVYNHGT